LALATVYGTVRQSGGHIWVYSEPGHGTTFKIYLPRTEAHETAAVALPRQLSRLTMEHAIVLLVEDEQVVRDMVVVALERRGYRVLPVHSAEAAIEILGRPETVVDLIVSDVIMPGMGGPELLEQVRLLRPGLPAILMSGHTALTTEQRPIALGVTVLEKPFTGEGLDEAIREVLSNAGRSRWPL
jgi:DNA-binding NtrC family response regulator